MMSWSRYSWPYYSKGMWRGKRALSDSELLFLYLGQSYSFIIEVETDSIRISLDYCVSNNRSAIRVQYQSTNQKIRHTSDAENGNMKHIQMPPN